MEDVENCTWCPKCGRYGKLVKEVCRKCTLGATEFANAREAVKSWIRNFPTLAVEQDMEEGSNLQALRKTCLVTGSKAGVLFNAKRGLSFLRWLEIQLGEAEEPPFSEYALMYMEAGRLMEPIIAQYFWGGLLNEYKATFGEKAPAENLMWVHPGMAMQKHQGYVLGATPDGLVAFYDGERFRLVVVEIKYYASKNTLPDQVPADYIAQILAQMETVGTDLCLYFCRVGEDVPFYEWRLFKKLPAHTQTLHERLVHAGHLLDAQRSRHECKLPYNYPKRYANHADLLDMIGCEMEVGRGDAFPQLLQTLLRNASSAALLK